MTAPTQKSYLNSSPDASALSVRTVQGAEAEAQRAARDAIMQIRLFPDLTVALRGALGYGPHVDVLQHFCYWMHPRHPKMQNRWTLYKTYAEWREECGLARKQIDKGRTKLRELGLVTEKKGPHGRLHYRVDWVVLAEVLSLSPVGEQSDELNDWFDDFDLIDDEGSLSPVGEQGQNAPQGEQGSLSPIGGQPNTGEYADDYVSENSTLQVAAEPAFAEPAAPQIDKEINQDKEGSAPLGDDQRHSENGHTPSETTAVKDEVEQVVAPPKPGDDTLLDDVREILEPDSGRWWGAKFISERRKDYAPGAVVSIMLNSVDEIEEPGTITEADKTELLEAVRYVMWEAEEEVG
jgi:hypothetical protein